ncbi:MAG: EF-P lysine aminoacylase EpmA [Desulfobacterales bacterium]|jgi:lysyl-tRNA synthetase class 2
MKDNRKKTLHSNLRLRACIIEATRQFFRSNGYLEVETPVRLPAPPPEAHIEAVTSGNWFLQTSPELCMKRMLAEGFPQLFQICKCFRQAERGHRHLPEMTLLEWYRTECTYLDLMKECEAFITHVAHQTGSGVILGYQGLHIQLAPPWPRIAVKDAFEKFASSPLEEALQNDQFDEIMVTQIEPRLGRSQPVFLVDYPACRAALAKLKPEDSRYAERFELYIGGLEICNAFSELIDPVEQRARFEHERDQRRKTGKPVYPMPEPFLTALKDLPPAAGNALGIDRLIMLFADTQKIDDVVAFTPEAL